MHYKNNMIKSDIKKLLIKIEIYWKNISKENSDDPDSFDFISTQSMSLKMFVLDLKNKIEKIIQNDTEAKLKFQMLLNSLENIVQVLDFKLQIYKDKEYIESILKKLSEIKKDIEVVKRYQ